MGKYKGFGVEYKFKWVEYVLFIGMFVLMGTSYWFGQTVVQHLVGAWFFTTTIDVSRRSDGFSPAFLVGFLMIFPAYGLVQLMRGKGFFKDKEKKSINGESLTIAVYGLSALYAMSSLVAGALA